MDLEELWRLNNSEIFGHGNQFGPLGGPDRFAIFMNPFIIQTHTANYPGSQKAFYHTGVLCESDLESWDTAV